jgi:hypothetical protein
MQCIHAPFYWDLSHHILCALINKVVGQENKFAEYMYRYKQITCNLAA